jgi:hypothetical protein
MLSEHDNEYLNSKCMTKNVQSFILLDWSRGVSTFIDADAIDLALSLKRKISQLTQ